MEERLEHLAKLGDPDAIKALARLNCRRTTRYPRRAMWPAVMLRKGYTQNRSSRSFDGMSGIGCGVGDGYGGGEFSYGDGNGGLNAGYYGDGRSRR